MDRTPVLSTIIPTHNRSETIEKNLVALERQSWPASNFDVLVVADSCEDNTVEIVKAFSKKLSYKLSLFHHEAKSAAASRNLGAKNANGKILLFLDDDVIAQPDLLKAHMEAYQKNHVALGYSKPILPEKPGWWHYDARRWWEDTYSVMRQNGHRFSYRDFFSGNVSMSAELFHRAGCFNTLLDGRLEDYELGYRLLKEGAQLTFVPEALGHHHESADLALWLRRIRQEGEGDARIGRCHPELQINLFAEFDNVPGPFRRMRKLIRSSAFTYPHSGDWLEKRLLDLAKLCENLRFRGAWRFFVGGIREYNYWRGVSAAFGGKRAFTASLQEAPIPPAVAINAPTIDLASPPPGNSLKEILGQATKLGLRLLYGGYEALTISPEPGKEPLREEHIRRAFLDMLKTQYFMPLAVQIIRARGNGFTPDILFNGKGETDELQQDNDYRTVIHLFPGSEVDLASDGKGRKRVNLEP